MPDTYWANYEDCLDVIVTRRGGTVEGVINVCNEHYPPSSGDAFFPGGADRDLLGTLEERGGWRIVWSEASYFWVAQDRNGDRLTYIEGDIQRGDHRSRRSHG